MPRVSVLETRRERSTAFDMSKRTLSNSMPQSLACFISLTSSAFLRRDFEGMHPQFRQTPPSPPIPVPSSFSTMATLRPSCAARDRGVVTAWASA